MEDAPRARSPLTEYEDPPVFRYTTEYFRRLLVERHAIRAALTNPGGSVVLHGVEKTTDPTQQYSSAMGSGVHCDLLDMEDIVNKLPPDQRLSLLRWVDGMPFAEQARLANVSPDALRMRKNRAMKAVAIKLTAREETNA